MSLTLVIMAAGLGSRFGGTKQLAEIGANGEAFLDLAIGDAIDAGMGKVVLIVRSDIEADVRGHVERHHDELDIAYVVQDTYGPRRDKPWGTGHAVLAAATQVDGSFVVINADDYYGRSTYRLLADAAAELPSDRALLAGFRLDQTLPERGEVSRGVCSVDDNELVSLVETHGIGRRDDGRITATDPEGELAADAVVSMNCWVFSPPIFDVLAAGFEAFHGVNADEPKAEYLLPLVVPELIAAGELTVGVVPTSEPWVGVTNPDDLEVARRRIAELRRG